LLERDLGIDAQREALFLFGEAVLEPPPFAAARGHFEVQAAAVE
jgi:hypothetical protein